ncbi:MAG: potassium channel family protein [Endozoicomonas sp.]
MNYFRLSLRFFQQQFLKLSWVALLVVLLTHFLLSWSLMWLAGEEGLYKSGVWFYFYITTSTTVGYGDLSPSGEWGRLVAALVIMPGGVVLFAALLGKLSSFFITMWRKGMQGRGSFSELDNHIVIFGWHRRHTTKMVELIFGDTRRDNRKVLLCTTEAMENPFPGKVLFIRGESLNDETIVERSGVERAARVIVFRGSDDQTLATCLTIAATPTRAHIVAWFEDEHMVRLLHSHCPQIECHSNISMELLVRSSQDPGSSRLQSQLLSTLVGPTQYSVRVPADFAGTTFGDLLHFFKARYEAIALGVADSATGDDLKLNPASSEPVKGGQVIYYMAAERIYAGEIAWDQF